MFLDYKGQLSNEVTSKVNIVKPRNDPNFVTFNDYCFRIRTLFLANDHKSIGEPIALLAQLIKNEDIPYIDILNEYKIPNILFQYISDDSYLIPQSYSINCLINISALEKSESIFDSEANCCIIVNILKRIKEKSNLKNILLLINNVIKYCNSQINSYFLNNHLIEIFLVICNEGTNSDIIVDVLESILVLSTEQLNPQWVLDIYRLFSYIQNGRTDHSLYMIKILNNLCTTDSIVFDAFKKFQVNNLITSIISNQSNGLNELNSIACKTISVIIEKFKCPELFKFQDILMLLQLEPTSIQEEACLCNAEKAFLSYITFDKGKIHKLLTEDNFRYFLYLLQEGKISCKLVMIKIFQKFVAEMNSETFPLVFIVEHEHNLFGSLSEVIQTEDPEIVFETLALFLSIFDKSVPFTATESCRECFQEVFEPSIFDNFIDLENEQIDQLASKLRSYLFNQ